jgi:hypothetical protein
MLMNARAELLPHHLPFTVVPAHALKRKLGAAAQNTANHMSSTALQTRSSALKHARQHMRQLQFLLSPTARSPAAEFPRCL